jgi:ribA/ribD-fused uncharacterized protein
MQDYSHMPDLGGEIRFYYPDEVPYGPLANYHLCPIHIDGRTYQSAEHAFQYLKAARKQVAEWIASAPDAFLAAVAGDNLPDHEIISHWSDRREEFMRAVLCAKFTQHAHLRQLLLSTGDAEIVEWAADDNEVNRFWSKVNGVGENVLGELLMELRNELAGAKSAQNQSGP